MIAVFPLCVIWWNPDIAPRYGMVDFDSAETTSKEPVSLVIAVYLCDFDREQAWHRCK